MTIHEINMFESSKENWKGLSIFLIIVLISILTIMIIRVSYSIGFNDCEYKIRKSGYSLTEINTKTNSYFIIDKGV